MLALLVQGFSLRTTTVKANNMNSGVKQICLSALVSIDSATFSKRQNYASVLIVNIDNNTIYLMYCFRSAGSYDCNYCCVVIIIIR